MVHCTYSREGTSKCMHACPQSAFTFDAIWYNYVYDLFDMYYTTNTAFMHIHGEHVG